MAGLIGMHCLREPEIFLNEFVTKPRPQGTGKKYTESQSSSTIQRGESGTTCKADYWRLITWLLNEAHATETEHYKCCSEQCARIMPEVACSFYAHKLHRRTVGPADEAWLYFKLSAYLGKRMECAVYFWITVMVVAVHLHLKAVWFTVTCNSHCAMHGTERKKFILLKKSHTLLLCCQCLSLEEESRGGTSVRTFVVNIQSSLWSSLNNEVDKIKSHVSVALQQSGCGASCPYLHNRRYTSLSSDTRVQAWREWMGKKLSQLNLQCFKLCWLHTSIQSHDVQTMVPALCITAGFSMPLILLTSTSKKRAL